MTAMSLEYTTYRIELQPRRSVRLPEFAGALVRGTFGKALRELTCATRAPTCADCPVARGCVYREVFDPLPPQQHALQRFSAIPAPYVLHVDRFGNRTLAAGKPFTFGISLVGSARRHLPLVVLAIQRGAAAGWTRDAVSFDLHRVLAESAGELVEVLPPGGSRLAEHGPTARIDSIPSAGTGVGGVLELELLTPTRLQQDGKPARAGDLQPRTWLMALVRRIALLADFHGDAPLVLDFGALSAAADQVAIVHAALRWQEWARYSGRQKAVMPMGGLVGQLRLEGPIAPFVPFLAPGRALHVGKHAAFGLGAFRFECFALPEPVVHPLNDAVQVAAARRHEKLPPWRH
jgi:hypothetical protein